MASIQIDGQLNAEERHLLTSAILEAPRKPRVVLEIGTWLGGGSTLHFLRALQQNSEGHLWGVEADRTIYDRMIANLRVAAPDAVERFTPLFGFSQKVIPGWLAEIGPETPVDVAFLDGGDNPMEQITEFQLLADRLPVGGQLLAHDAKLRKGKWLRPYLALLDNWEMKFHDISVEGILTAVKLRAQPSPESAKAAARKLAALRRHPVELLGSLLPSGVNAAMLKLLPTSLRKSVSQGR